MSTTRKALLVLIVTAWVAVLFLVSGRGEEISALESRVHDPAPEASSSPKGVMEPEELEGRGVVSFPNPLDLAARHQVDVAYPTLESIFGAENWDEVDSNWHPTPEAMEYWLRLRIDQVQRILDGKPDRARDVYGWEREWPPAEGFPTQDDYDRITRTDLEAWKEVLRWKTAQWAVGEIREARQNTLDAPKLARLWSSYDHWIEVAYNQIGKSDPYPGWNDLIRLGARMQIQ